MGVLTPDYMDSMQVATQYLLPELAGKSLTPKLSVVVADAFVTRFGSYAGWAQNVLFIGPWVPRNPDGQRCSQNSTEIATASPLPVGTHEKVFRILITLNRLAVSF